MLFLFLIELFLQIGLFLCLWNGRSNDRFIGDRPNTSFPVVSHVESQTRSDHNKRDDWGQTRLCWRATTFNCICLIFNTNISNSKINHYLNLSILFPNRKLQTNLPKLFLLQKKLLENKKSRRLSSCQATCGYGPIPFFSFPCGLSLCFLISCMYKYHQTPVEETGPVIFLIRLNLAVFSILFGQ